MAHTIALLDCSAGVTAPLVLGALLDSGLGVKPLEAALASLPAPLSSYVLRAEKGAPPLAGTVASIIYKGVPPVPSWRLANTSALILHSSLEARVRQRVLAMVDRMAAALSKAYGLPAEEVEMSSHAPLLALIAVALGFDMLNLSRLYASSLPLTPGYHQLGADGDSLPSIALETLNLLTSIQVSWHTRITSLAPISLEGAALLSEYATFEPASDVVITQIGYGLIPSFISLRLCLARPSAPPVPQSVANTPLAATDQITVIETNIDNMSGELLGALMDRLLALGALDVSYTPMQMKKNRPATLVRVICKLEDGEALAMHLLSETSTLGVRMQHMRRLKAHREQRHIETPFGPIQVKLKLLGDRVISAAPEYEECARVASTQGIPLAQVYEVAFNAVQSLIIRNSKNSRNNVIPS